MLAHLSDDVRAGVVVTAPVADRLAVPDGVERVVVPLARHRKGAPAVARALAALAPDVVHLNLVDPGSNRAARGLALGARRLLALPLRP